MLVIISDLHLTDGTTGTTTSPGAFRAFAQRLREMAMCASWRLDGRYRPIGRIDLVLLGDVLDLVRSARWTARKDVRPWSDSTRPEFVDTVTKIASDILRFNEAALEHLRGVTREGQLALPPADRHGAPAAEAEAQPLEVRAHYLVGNADWFLHLPGKRYDLLRQALVGQLGLANRADEPFPHDPAECGELQDALRRHKVFARHGDAFDPLSYSGDRSASSLADALAVELIDRFAAAAEQQLGNDLPSGTLWGLRELDQVRPLPLVPLWLEGMLQRSCPSPSLRQQAKRLWDRHVDELLSLSFVRQRKGWAAGNLVDELERSLKFGKRPATGWSAAIGRWMESLGGHPADFARHAMSEPDFRNRRAKHIVYGHTHLAETVPLDASYADGYVLNQVYFNTGTWRRVHRPTRWDAAEHEFIPSEGLAIAAFYQGDERGGRAYETWTGTLDVGPAPISLHRIDAGSSRAQATSAAHRPRPHFSTTSIDVLADPPQRSQTN